MSVLTSGADPRGRETSRRRDEPLRVHLLVGLPTETVQRALERAHDAMPVVPLGEFGNVIVGDANRLGVLLPPFVEPSMLLDSWADCDFLYSRFDRPAYVAGISTFVDVDRLVEQLASTTPLSQLGWGKSEFDRRTVADIVVGQIESATHLVLMGASNVTDFVSCRLDVLNPPASRVRVRDESRLAETEVSKAFGFDLLDRGLTDANPARSIEIIPPWLEVLNSGCDSTPGSDVLVYRRALPFDPIRFRDWVASPPEELVRGKGHVWLAGEPDTGFGYSCAGFVHRVFAAGRWWASHSGGEWPTCTTQRRRLLERWHPRFGDRRQELVFLGVDVDRDRLFAGLDQCLVEEHEFDGDGVDVAAEVSQMGWTPERGLH